MNIIVLFLCFMFHAARATSSAQPVVFGASNEDTSTNATILMLLFVFVFAFIITGFCTISIRYCSEEYTIRNPHNTSGSHYGIDPHVLVTFPVMPYSAVKRLKTYQNAALQCAVCLGEFTDVDDALRLLPKCSHVFHTDCIDRWLASHVTCPTCRAKLNGEVSVEIEGEARARHVFDESSMRRGEGVGGGNGSRVCGNIDGCVGKGNGCSKVEAFGVLLRSHSTGHSLERFTIKLPMKQSLDDGKRGRVMMMKRSASYDVVLGIGEGGEGSTSKGKNNNNKWVLSMTPPFVSCDLPNVSTTTTCSGIPRFWMREEKECEGRTVFEVL